jgi:hypothetical protein
MHGALIRVHPARDDEGLELLDIRIAGPPAPAFKLPHLGKHRAKKPALTSKPGLALRGILNRTCSSNSTRQPYACECMHAMRGEAFLCDELPRPLVVLSNCRGEG